MRRMYVAMFGCVVGSAAAMGQNAETKPAAELTDPTAILEKADAASKAVEFVKYTAQFKGLGASEATEPKVEGTVYLKGYKNNLFEKGRFEGKVTVPGSSETRNLVMGTDGNEYFLIDHDKKMAYVDIDLAVVGMAGRLLGALAMNEFVHETPFTDEIKGETKELKGSEKIGAEDCYHIYVKYSQAGQEADWYFSKKDFLPRRVDRKFTRQNGGDPIIRQLVVTSLTVDPKPEKDPFKFELPAGYTKSDDFAP